MIAAESLTENDKNLAAVVDELLDLLQEGQGLDSSHTIHALQAVFSIPQQVRELDDKQPGLGRTILRRAREHEQDYFDIASTISYTHNVSQNASPETLIALPRTLARIKSDNGLTGQEYRLFLDYLVTFPSDSAPDARFKEFEAVMLKGVLKTYIEQGRTRVTDLREIEGTWNACIDCLPTDDPLLPVATLYRNLEELYGIDTRPAETLVRKHYLGE